MANYDARPIGQVPGEGEIAIGATGALLIEGGAASPSAPPDPDRLRDDFGAGWFLRLKGCESGRCDG